MDTFRLFATDTTLKPLLQTASTAGSDKSASTRSASVAAIGWTASRYPAWTWAMSITTWWSGWTASRWWADGSDISGSGMSSFWALFGRRLLEECCRAVWSLCGSSGTNGVWGINGTSGMTGGKDSFTASDTASTTGSVFHRIGGTLSLFNSKKNAVIQSQ